jgi:hypothetical protein
MPFQCPTNVVMNGSQSNPLARAAAIQVRRARAADARFAAVSKIRVASQRKW